MFDKATYEVRDEDREVVGEVRRIFHAGDGWMWRAWAIMDGHTGYRETKLALWGTPEEAQAEIERYWGIIR